MKRRALLLAFASLWFASGQKRKQERPPDVEMTAASAHRAPGRRINLDGRVKNVGQKPIENLILVFDFLTAGEKVITTQRGPIDSKWLEPAESCEFHFQMTDHARAVSFRVRATSKGFELLVANGGPFPVE